MAYQYSGAIHDVNDPIPDLPPEEYPTCGTVSGYKRHRRHGQEACHACKEAKREQSRREYAAICAKKPRPRDFLPDVCGTYAGYRRHYRHGVAACPACLTAYADYMHNYRARRKVAA